MIKRIWQWANEDVFNHINSQMWETFTRLQLNLILVNKPCDIITISYKMLGNSTPVPQLFLKVCAYYMARVKVLKDVVHIRDHVTWIRNTYDYANQMRCIAYHEKSICIIAFTILWQSIIEFLLKVTHLRKRLKLLDSVHSYGEEPGCFS